ncbi:MAG: hypothetical protein GX802_04070, partial [Clostridiales bacterium]|nr:hypothetical protein [Clostridiales bacterium]
MKKITIFFSILITICIALTLVYSPNYILENSNRNVLLEWKSKGRYSFAGIINVWHVIGFKAHSGSTSFWLSTRAVEFENKYNNVYINVIPMSVEEYHTMLASGEKPDMLSYPLGLDYCDSFLPYDDSFSKSKESELNSYLKDVGKVESTTYALPYFYSGYALM